MLGMRKLVLAAAVLWLASGFSAAFTAADGGVDLEPYSELIVRGRVVGMESSRENPGGIIYTDARVSVDEYLKGSGEDTLSVRYVGGETEGRGLLVGNMPRFDVGEEVLLYLEKARTMPGELEGIFEVVGYGEGKVSLSGGVSAAGEVSASHTGYVFLRAHNGSFLNWHPSDLPIQITISTWRLPIAVRPADAVYWGLKPWEEVGTASVSFDYRGTVPDKLSAEEDGRNMIGWTALAWVAGTAYPNAAAVTYIAWYDADTNYFREVDIAFNSFLQWSTTGEPNKYDIQGVATHEIGHLLGLGHTASFVAQGGTVTTMIDGGDFWNLGYGAEDTVLLRTLHPIDEQGLSILYPPGYPGSEVPRGPGGGCFIATAAYGSPLAEEVYLLSRFRDGVLLGNRAGRAAVYAYNAASPALARAVSGSTVLAGVARAHVSPLVGLVRILGVSERENKATAG